MDFSGPAFEHVDNRFAALTLVQKGLCDAALFSPQGKSCDRSAPPLAPLSALWSPAHLLRYYAQKFILFVRSDPVLGP